MYEILFMGVSSIVLVCSRILHDTGLALILLLVLWVCIWQDLGALYWPSSFFVGWTQSARSFSPATGKKNGQIRSDQWKRTQPLCHYWSIY